MVAHLLTYLLTQCERVSAGRVSGLTGERVSPGRAPPNQVLYTVGALSVKSFSLNFEKLKGNLHGLVKMSDS